MQSKLQAQAGLLCRAECKLKLGNLLYAERSASSSGTNTPRLRFADLGGAAWGREAPTAAYTSLPPTALHQSMELQRTAFPGPITSTSFHPAPPLLRPPSSPLGSTGGSGSFPHRFPHSFPHTSEASIWGTPVGSRAPTLQVYPSIHGGSPWADAERSHSGPQAGDLAASAMEWGDTQPTSPFARPGSAPGARLNSSYYCNMYFRVLNKQVLACPIGNSSTRDDDQVQELT